MIAKIVMTLVFLVLFMGEQIMVNALNPYSILGVSKTATDSEIESKYKRMRSRSRGSRVKKNMVRQAYDQIMVERKFNARRQQPEDIVSPYEKAKSTLPLKIDEAYVYGYKLEDEFDNGGYFNAHFNETKHIIERMKNSEENKKNATIFIVIGGMFMKILPCIITVSYTHLTLPTILLV